MLKSRFFSVALLVVMLFSQSVPQALAATYCDHAQFVSDLTAPDGSSFAPGTTFTKTWRFTNIGTCTWTTSYNIASVGGDLMGAPLSVNLPVNVSPGQMVDVSINLVAPMTGGHYKGLWKFGNASGVQFGIGDSASEAFWVDINVVETNAVIYDFVANAPYAQWKSGAGPLPFPGTSGDSRGFGYQVNNPHLEDDSIDVLPGLLTVPQNKYNGYIQATYPEFQIQSGDKLQTLVNCEFGATSCYVTFRIDYLLSNGVQKTLWSWKEAYEKRFYRANIDLSPLAGQKVRFVFLMLSSGLAGGDRAIWGSPRIVRTGTTQPPAPPPTLTLLPPLTPTTTPIAPPPTILPSGCDKATFVTDVTVPDGTIFSPGAAFTKTWRLKNSGSCTWTMAYKLMYYSGEVMSAPTSVNLPWSVSFDQTVDITINMIAPASAGAYRGDWILSNANGQLFGIGSNAASPIWIEINVAGGSPINAGYDFFANLCAAEWKSGAGILPCPGTDNDSRGFVLKQDAPKLEDGSTGAPGLLTFPQNRFNGYIQGYYPAFTVQPGDRFQTIVGCESGAACYVTYRLDYMTATGFIATFWQWREKNEGKFYNANVDLTPLAGRSVRFILTILATGFSTGDRAIWVAPRITREGGAIPTSTPAPPTATPTTTPLPQDFNTFGQSLVTALNTRNFTTVRTMMDQSFGFALWQSQGISETADAAIESLRTFYLSSSTPLTPDAGKDLNILLDGLNPYAIMGLNASNSQALFVSGWGQNGNQEAILYFTRRTDGTIYWHSVLIAQSSFLRVEPVSHEAFCADTRIPVLIEQLKGSMNQSNGDVLSALVSPVNGLDIRLWAMSTEVTFNKNTAKTVFTNTESYSWGGGPSGQPDIGTFKDIIQPKLLEVFNASNMETYCDNLTKVFPLSVPWPYPDMRYYNFYKPSSEQLLFDFRTWLIGFEYVNGTPYLSAMASIVWEP